MSTRFALLASLVGSLLLTSTPAAATPCGTCQDQYSACTNGASNQYNTCVNEAYGGMQQCRSSAWFDWASCIQMGGPYPDYCHVAYDYEIYACEQEATGRYQGCWYAYDYTASECQSYYNGCMTLCE